MKVLVITEQSCVGGSERHALNVVQGLSQQAGLEVHVLVTDLEGALTPQFQEASDRYDTCHYIFNPIRQYPHERPKPPIEVYNYINDYIIYHDIDVVHLFNGIQYVFAVPENVPLVVQLGGDLARDVYYSRVNLDILDTDLKDPKKVVTSFLNSRKNTYIVTDKDENRRIFKKCIVSSNYVPYIPVSGIKKRKKTVLWVGRLSLEKNPELYFQIAEKLPEYEFLMILSKNDWELVPNHPKNVKIFENVLNPVEIAEIYEESEVLLNTSDTEGQPLTVTEARQHGCFIIGLLPILGQADHIITNPDVVMGFVDGIKGYQMLSKDQKQFYDTKSRRKACGNIHNLLITNLIRTYKELLK